MLYYVPLEPYPNRYTMQWSAPKTGWLERHWIAENIPYCRINGPATVSVEMGLGQVLNPVSRAEWAFGQIMNLIKRVEKKEITNNDVIYFDDFWHPGIEQLKYTLELAKIRPKLYSFCHAQSVDKYDFTADFGKWMKSVERGFADIYTGVFVNNSMLEELLLAAWPGTQVHNIGHVFCSREVLERGFAQYQTPPPKEELVVYSARFDPEKNPRLFMRFAANLLDSDDEIKFVICSGSLLRSRDEGAIRCARNMASEYKDRFQIAQNLTKEEYYSYLIRAKYHISTALQDWISFCLLEAVTFKCVPIYPNFRSYPEAFGCMSDSLYPYTPSQPGSDPIPGMLRAFEQARVQADDPVFLQELFHTIVNRHDQTWRRMCFVMGLLGPGGIY